MFELANEVTFPAHPIDLGLVVGAEVVVVGLGVGEHVPDDGQERVPDRDDGLGSCLDAVLDVGSVR
jgi:hypothetical protein